MPTEPPPEWVLTLREVVGRRIREARLAADLSQVALAELVGVDHKTVHRIEYGTRDPSLGLLLQLARALRVPLADLVRE
ncbi:helix-turn-helix transcriptional regulator [Streptomyces sp. ISL-100]|uniref:helix-turn-helix transcriptional regulator n=1 Tax=Streptomyces sp. ISL-100 TaxID=2819173 RepID=UPI001BE6FDE6|nr:helix-turn-helix transcriptional regulator [Streptomyces sp. ISL-100]MBT2401141.1 helix-turn-helix transcriptional regulator [Streptomyces sp. ISL-100]